MGRRRRSQRLGVWMNGRRVGLLRREPDGAIAFVYNPGWLELPDAIPVSLSMPLREERFHGAPVRAVLENLLPDDERIRRRVAERMGAEGADAYSLLAAIGHDCVGALQFLEEGVEPGPAGGIEARPLDEAGIARLLDDLSAAPLGLDRDLDFRISIAGAQEKTALTFLDGRWCKPAGATATTHILKPAIGRLSNGIDLSHSIENEFLCLRLTEALGLPSARVSMQAFAGTRALVVERFDRRWTRDGRLLRLPQEDCCQALSVPPTRKYQADGGPGMAEVLDLLKGSDQPGADRAVFLRATLVFWLLAATDGHAKNFSLALRAGGRFTLSPLYDVLSAQPSLDAGQIQRRQMRLAMSVGDRRHYAVDEIVPRHFEQAAARAGLSRSVVHAIFDDLAGSAGPALERVVRELPPDFPPEVLDPIAAGMRRRLLFLGRG
ncbi:type II toxin-antitoxin system HipA family toxin [Geminicoccus roseus]|uniref:type II toxin-antitoxin system HipA family toxin n=1 Tax=Geminicoccus roseus TaxID=404900 RepID=UPI0003F987F2|nr:type II toxin-antitoxin system HipA family toxin [Geminicoccus roseus]